MRKLLKWLLFLAFIFSALSCSAASNRYRISLELLYGQYEVTGFKQFRGGITTEDFAKKQIGTKVSVTKDKFVIRDISIKSPIYKIQHINVNLPEGNIISGDLSVFYGYKDTRKEVVRLLVFSNIKDVKTNDWDYSLEIFDTNNLLDMYDGRFYFIKRVNPS